MTLLTIGQREESLRGSTTAGHENAREPSGRGRHFPFSVHQANGIPTLMLLRPWTRLFAVYLR